MRCPRCNYEQPDAAECAACGVIVQKALAAAARGGGASGAPASVARRQPSGNGDQPAPAAAEVSAAVPPPPPGPSAAAAAVQKASDAVHRLRGAMVDMRATGSGVATLSPVSRAQLLRELGEMTSQGVPLPRAVSALAGAMRRGERAKALTALAASLQRGDSLAAALQMAGFDPLEVALVRSAELSGSVGPALVALARRLQHAIEIGQQIRAGLGQPLMLALSGAALLPAPRAIADGFGAWAAAAAIGVIAVFVVAGVLLFGAPWLMRAPAARARLLAIGAALPIVGGWISHRRYSLLFGALAPALQAGIALDDALTIAGEAVGEPTTALTARAVGAEVRRQGGLAEAARKLPGVDEETLGRLATAELTGDLAGVCQERATTFAQRHIASMAAAARALRFGVATAVTVAIAISIVGQLGKMIGDPMAMLPAGERGSLERELQRAMPQLGSGILGAPGAGAAPAIDEADLLDPDGAARRRRKRSAAP